MLLTKREKQLLIRVLKKEKRKKWFGSQEDPQLIEELIEKIEQSQRNEKMNEVKSSKL
ncbi:hypothetical protein [Texcoconibacillus texcoconensis]|uniref:Mg/Co/Ni transporter MgtE n=1 Tax=Texcoconibacillus texcoconensis TaxID=1095777 RepID=A0A840QQK6_9BACI|nr:hypothetical protein [Texcoconibacillus texcoconensis]MBB5173640.1 Mg/Co/Ni transporter MgtE [Texcoconibacillus texcoconensis]